MIDPFGREITYLRVSVTDRCDFRCVYCMSEDMTFLPKAEVLSLEELDRLCSAFVRLGVRKLRLTGGEPLVRRNIMWLFRRLGRHLRDRRARRADPDHQRQPARQVRRRSGAAGVRRVNVSLDTLDPDKFQAITRWGKLDKVMEGLAAAKDRGPGGQDQHRRAEGRQRRRDRPPGPWCGDGGVRPDLHRGDADGRHRRRGPARSVLAAVAWSAHPVQALDPGWTRLPDRRPGPLRAGRRNRQRIGFITPLTHNFCESCNRVRLSCEGTLYMCLGQEDAADLRTPLRASEDDAELVAAIHEAIGRKPKGHDFVIDRRRSGRSVSRHMSVTGSFVL